MKNKIAEVSNIVGIMMVYGFNKEEISSYKEMREVSYVVKSQRKIFCASLIVSFFALMVFVPFASVEAMGTTKASALVLKEISAGDSLSFKRNPPTAQADSCLSFLYASRLPLDASVISQTRRPVGKIAVPVALGFVLGIRIALGPKEVVESSKRVKIGPEIRAGRTVSGNHALAIAAYRSCKNRYFLGLLKNKNNKKQVIR